MRNSRGKHSFIQFYPDQWNAGTAHMSRVVESVYFQVCKYNWDKTAPVPPSRLRLLLADLEGQGEIIVSALVEDGALVRNEDGSVHSPRAIAEAEKSYEAWEAKSRGGKHARGNTPASKLQDTSNKDGKTVPQKEKEKEIEIENSRSPNGDSSSGADDTPAMVPVPAVKSKDIADAWNDMARTCGLSQVAKLTDARRKHLRNRVAEHGADKIIAAIQRIPQSRFLTGRTGDGWKANFDWLLQPSSCAKLIEGTYHNDGKGKGSAWLP